ncbi:type II toxin-antitoxin system RelE/ParE family toxin [Pararhodobacter sp. SW119]|uniref:type II toxin-antitoxin system RelE/ParE family toxin n=1 Tax=Pararhodobacter sp. SW119 TaxID=2780075 RepID=UPI002473AD1B|nr:type II toxin-antitoxin system RelE/ParE family toxin [Pararhodobacter sp. SW119]
MKYVRRNGRCPVDEWRESLSERDEAKITAVVMKIESHEVIPRDTVKKYLGAKEPELHEMKVRGDKKQLRPLCVKDTQRKLVVLLFGAEKTSKNLARGDITKAENLLREMRDGNGSLKDYHED